MVVKIPINRGKRTSEKTLLESPGTKTTMVTNENETAYKFGVAASAAAKRKNSKHTFSSHNNEGDVGDNSSISSRSSMNSACSIDQDVRDGIINDVNDVKSTTSAAAANATAAAASTKVLSSEDCTLTICSPSDQSRDQIDYSYSSPDTLLIGVSFVICERCFTLSLLLSHAFLFFYSMI